MLFDLQIDKDENNNVVNDPEYREIVLRLKNVLHSEYERNITGTEKKK